MKAIRHRVLLLSLAAGLLLLASSMVVYGYEIPWKVIDGGGAEATSSSFIVMNSIGQSVIGEAQSGSYRLHVGYWQTELGVGVSEKPLSRTVMPTVFSLKQNFPNPASGLTTIQYNLPKESSVHLRVTDAAGRLVTTLVDATEKAGYRRAVWDGKDSGGRAVAAGTYFYRLNAGTFCATRKLLLLR